MSALRIQFRPFLGLLWLMLVCVTPAYGGALNRAADFSSLPKSAKILIMSPDIELFSISAGGMLEPKADWTEAANQHVRAALKQRSSSLNLTSRELSETDADEFAEISTLHAAVARSIGMHHFGPSNLALPTKSGKLDWSLGDAVAPLKAKVDADYALFVWMRDSYASSERQATMVVMALFGVGLVGGSQIGYASLVDLRNGQVVWFNQLRRGSGDLREAPKAKETIDALLDQFPETK